MDRMTFRMKFLVHSILDFIVCFRYGQTGTGKTFTMEGERSVEASSWEDVSEDNVMCHSP